MFTYFIGFKCISSLYPSVLQPSKNRLSLDEEQLKSVNYNRRQVQVRRDLEQKINIIIYTDKLSSRLPLIYETHDIARCKLC
jgi:hypothetical protein